MATRKKRHTVHSLGDDLIGMHGQFCSFQFDLQAQGFQLNESRQTNGKRVCSFCFNGKRNSSMPTLLSDDGLQQLKQAKRISRQNAKGTLPAHTQFLYYVPLYRHTNIEKV